MEPLDDILMPDAPPAMQQKAGAAVKTDEQINDDLLALTQARDVLGIEQYGRDLEQHRRLPPRTIMAIAQALRDAGAGPAALAWFGRIEPVDKPFAYARAQMARILQAGGDYQGVLRLTDDDPPESIAEPLAIARVRALAALRRLDDTVTFLEAYEARRAAPAAMLEAAADAAIAASGWAAAFPYLDKAASRSDDLRVRLRRAVALFQLDRTDDALIELEVLAAVPEFFVRAKTVCLRIYNRGSDPGLVIRTCEEILEKAPDSEFALECLIRQHIESRSYDEAEAVFSRASAARPDRFIPEMFDFLVKERRGLVRAALAPFHDGRLDNNLPDDVKERIANAFYFSGQFEPARRLADQLEEERQVIMRSKIKLASGQRIGLKRLPGNIEGRLIKSLALYLDDDFDACIALLRGLESGPSERLGVRNLLDLATSRRGLSNLFFQPAAGVPIDTSTPLPTIQQLWVGSELSYIERLSIRSFVAAGHPTHLYTYDPKINAPPGCVVRDAGEILPASMIFAHSEITGRSKGSLAGFADLFRWKLLFERGGLWADCDVVCLEPLASPRIVSTELARVGTVVVPAITNCLFGAEAGEAAFGRAFDDAVARDNDQLLWGEIGIHKMAELVAAEGWGERLTAPDRHLPHTALPDDRRHRGQFRRSTTTGRYGRACGAPLQRGDADGRHGQERDLRAKWIDRLSRTNGSGAGTRRAAPLAGPLDDYATHEPRSLAPSITGGSNGRSAVTRSPCR